MNYTFNIPGWRITEYTGYKPFTTFWQDYWIAVPFGVDAVKDTYRRAFDEWKSSHEYMTEMALVLNHIGWALYKKPEKKELAQVFFELYEKLDEWCYENFTEEQRAYYFSVTD